ncbi:hypothetical protein [Agarivorans litoreus]|uniref:hypothetical protein n=1 Tax=Agarivorans litoreus TaxID=1510455 RepID=UPI001C7DD004|nr:hypothetical protein [Agarivorans litoreus]
MSNQNEDNTVFLDLFSRGEKGPWTLLLINFGISFLHFFLGNLADDKYGKLPNYIALTLIAFILTFLSVNVYLKMSGRDIFVGAFQGYYSEKKYDKKGYLATLVVTICGFSYLIWVINLLFYP